tara:strand:- start:931 stop:1191 length:261 start_codon:yes stop_codon:yes gene_type:complete
MMTKYENELSGFALEHNLSFNEAMFLPTLVTKAAEVTESTESMIITRMLIQDEMADYIAELAQICAASLAKKEREEAKYSSLNDLI